MIIINQPKTNDQIIDENIDKSNSTEIIDEAANYQPNELVSNAIKRKLANMGFYYSAILTEPNSDDAGIPIMLDVVLNDDDIDVIMSDNVIYCYFDSSKLDYKAKIADPTYYDKYSNLLEVISATKLVPVNPKAWRDDTKLYLLKIHLNSGIIRRFDPAVARFRNQEINWNTSTVDEIVELLLTKDYLNTYLSAELSSLESYLNFMDAKI